MFQRKLGFFKFPANSPPPGPGPGPGKRLSRPNRTLLDRNPIPPYENTGKYSGGATQWRRGWLRPPGVPPGPAVLSIHRTKIQGNTAGGNGFLSGRVRFGETESSWPPGPGPGGWGWGDRASEIWCASKQILFCDQVERKMCSRATVVGIQKPGQKPGFFRRERRARLLSNVNWGFLNSHALK